MQSSHIRPSFGSEFLGGPTESPLSLSEKKPIIPGHRADSLLQRDGRPTGVGGSVFFGELRDVGPALAYARESTARNSGAPTARGLLGSRQRLAARRYSPLVPIRGGGARSLRGP
ncbi:hypothetical protein MTO96_002924 [Rhipicephalus appendiculatus]